MITLANLACKFTWPGLQVLIVNNYYGYIQFIQITAVLYCMACHLPFFLSHNVIQKFDQRQSLEVCDMTLYR